MNLSLLIAFQAAASAAANAAPADFDLARHGRAPNPLGSLRRCAPGEEAGEIVVCGRRRGEPDAAQMEEWARKYPEKPLKAEIDLGGGMTGRAYVEGVEIAPGLVSKRMMFGIKTKF